MLEYMNRLRLRPDGSEQQQRGRAGFPCSVYQTILDDYARKEVPWHWHEEIELKLVFSGTAQVSCNDKTVLLHPGEGLFINSRVLHYTHSPEGTGCVLGSIVFGLPVLEGSPGSVFEEPYFQPVYGNPALSAVSLCPGVLWQEQALEEVRRAYDAGAGGALGYELDMRSGLSRFWSSLVRGNQSVLAVPRPRESITNERVRCMLAFLEEHFTEDLTPADLAEAAHISERECFRCFRQMTGMTPVTYLLHRRITWAAKQLQDTSLTITDICTRAGFHSPSYFGRKFREQMGCSPREFRALKL